VGVRVGFGGAALAIGLGLGAAALAAPSAADRFREANEKVRAGDYPKGIALYEEIAGTGAESASLYWNWAQAASARGAQGEALWALLRARELDPSDRAVLRDIERLREGANLDRAEIAPEPLAALARASRRYRLDLLAALLLGASLATHAVRLLRPSAGGLRVPSWTALVLGIVVAAAPVTGALARPTGAVVRRGAPLFDAASPTAEPVGTLREGEVVPILEASGDYVRVEDSSGARGWASASDVRPVGAPPRAR
jgi:SH3 domain-containing protein